MGTGAEYALAAIAVGATVGKAYEEKQAEQADLSAINQQSKLLALQYQEKNLHNLDMTEKILQRQAAQFSTRGVSYNSPSFNAIQRETINIGARNEGKLNAEESLANQGLDIERKNVRNTLHAQLFGDATNLAFGGIDFLKALPTKEKLPAKKDI